MPRPKKPDVEGKEVKKRSRNGCWPCKSRKVKCGEEKPSCANCLRQGETCDYSIRLNWDGRSKKKEDGKLGSQIISFAPSSSASAGSPEKYPHSLTHGSPSNVSIRTNSLDGTKTQQPLPAILRSPPSVQDTSLPFTSPPANNPPLPPSDFNPTILPAPPVLRNPQWTENKSNGTLPLPNSMPPLRHSLSMPSYPSPSDSAFGSPGLVGGFYHMNGPSMHMPPPNYTSYPNTYQPDPSNSPYNPAKRRKLSPQYDGKYSTLLQRAGSYGPNDGEGDLRVQFNPNTPTFFPPHLSNPLTPAASSVSLLSQDNDDRRISVSSLLSEEPAESNDSYTSYPLEMNPSTEHLLSRRGSLHQRMISYSETELYGHDRGNPDLDIPRNNDTMAISGMSPSEHSDFGQWLDAEFDDSGFGFGVASRDTVFVKGGYYASPVPIKIPRKLEPLPKTLSENPMNLLYFHHFLNHTARILVPHDCPENPFKTILPKMAVDNPNLLNLMLAYSACHRARLLSHPEPVNRIAHWVRDVFPSLRQTLEHVSSHEVSNANLATAIMLASLEIISPASFGVSIPWQQHLSIARGVVRSRGGPHSVSRKDPVMYFLTRWLAYLDVMGSLSGRRNEEPLFGGNYWSSSHDENISAKELSLADDDGEDEDDYTIDCLLGFTTRCVSILAQVALLARECESGRINSETGQVDPDWRPSAEISKRAERLKSNLEQARNHEQKHCVHHSPHLTKATLVNTDSARRRSVHMTDVDSEEALATNSAFHWAGLVHLLRRVDNLPRSDLQVQIAVHEIVKVITTIREGGSAEACLLFPMFTAGVEAEDPLDRAEVLARIKGAEELGMCQVSRARKIMEEVWKTGGSWEALVTGEFFG